MDKKLESEEDDKGGAWEARILCGDESCIGVIGPDGRCKECGRPYDGPLPLPAQLHAVVKPSDDYDAPEDAQTDGDEGEAEDSEGTDPDWQARKLCRDESCIGVIGPDGRCKECGRPYDE
ncbi:MAG: hypothetical protein HY911_11970 [Desulfobacterales bacterium]|nr:hypothetical protein [Desulfobacterales bacterium]